MASKIKDTGCYYHFQQKKLDMMTL